MFISSCNKKWRGFVFFSALLGLVGCGGSSSSSNNNQGGGSTAVTVTVASAPTSIGAGANYQFSATVTGRTDQTVSWSASAGTIDATGLYIAPNTVPSPAAVTITANSGAGSTVGQGTTNVTVVATDPLGTITSSVLPSCSGNLQGATCYQLTVSCPGIADIDAYLKVNTPSGTAIGTVLFGVGTGGSGLYDDPTAGGFQYGSEAITSVLQADYNTVQVSFGAPFTSTQQNGWLQGPGGVRRLACRYATIAQWVYNNPQTINPASAGTTSAPLCATGNSGGSGAIAYAVWVYGLDSIFSMVEPTSGPPMARIDQGCAPCSASNVVNPANNVCATSAQQMCYQPADASLIDGAYQATGASSPTPCTDGLNGGTPPAGLLLSDSILFESPLQARTLHSSVKQLFGGMDGSPDNAVPQGVQWGDYVIGGVQACVQDAPHELPNVSDGAAQIATDIINLCH